VVVGDFNRANLKKVMPNVQQHIPCATKADKTMDHCYTTFKRGYKAASLPPFAKSDNATTFLLPEDNQRIAWEAVVTMDVKQWSDQTEADHQDALIDWDMFSGTSSSDVSEFTDVVTSFKATLAGTIIPTVEVRSFPNPKQWVDGSICGALEALYPATWTNTACHPTDSSEQCRTQRGGTETEWSHRWSSTTPDVYDRGNGLSGQMPLNCECQRIR